MGKDNRTISVRITSEQLSALKKEAALTGATVGALARKGVDLYLSIEHPVRMHGFVRKKARKTHTVSA